jgi:hypothetical protein
MPGSQNELRLPDLRIVGFRAFKELEIKRLGRVNLLTGKNNSGKSSVLEALRLYASAGSKNLMQELVDSRDESTPTERRTELPVLNLFHGRITVSDLPRGFRFEIGPMRIDADRLIAEAGWWDMDIGPAVKLKFGVRDRAVITLGHKDQIYLSELESFAAQYVGPLGVSAETVGEMWKGINLTDLEDQLVACLKLIAQDVERVSVLPSGSGDRPIPFVRVKGASRPIPLRSLGDGMNRLFGIGLALVNAQNGFLLIDEIENGIHYSVQPRLWKFIVQNAERLNVQVFATTHSWDCITAFQEATNGNGSDGMLIRLDWRDGAVRAVELTEDQLAIVTEQRIEVR